MRMARLMCEIKKKNYKTKFANDPRFDVGWKLLRTLRTQNTQTRY